MADEELQQKYMELQMAAEQVKQLQSHLQTLESKGEELQANIDSIKAISSKKCSEFLVPIVDGIFVRAKADNTKSVIVNVGAGAGVKKDAVQAAEMLKEKREEMRQYGRELRAELEKKTEAARKLEEEMGALLESSKG